MSEAVLATETNRSQLQQIIAGLSDGVILIETDKARTLLWANQAALAMHGVSGVEELGANVREYARRYALRYRNNHSLALASYPINRVAAGEIFSDVVVQVQARIDGEPRRWVHRVRSMILNDRSGQPESLVLILSDASDWASAEQRFERTFSANPAPAVICRLSDLRYIKVNPGFLEMTGYARDQVIGRSVYELDVLEGAEHKDLAIERLGQGGTIPQMQAELRLPEGGSKLVIVAGQPLDINDEDCMLFSFMDLEPRRRVEIALRHSEERFAKSFRLNPVPTLVCSAEQQILDVNEAFIDSCGYSSEELLGRTLSETACLAADGAAALLFGQLEKLGKVSGLDLQVRKKGGELMDCVAYADTLVLEDRPCYLLVLMDISRRKRSELELVEAIEEVMRDASWFSRTLIEKLANVRNTRSAVASGVTSADLTAREREVLGLIYQGLADKEIAARLKLAPNTVRNHVATLYSKLDVHSRGEAIVWARERGLFAGSAG